MIRDTPRVVSARSAFSLPHELSYPQLPTCSPACLTRGLRLCANSNIESAPPTARLTKIASKNAHLNLSAKARCAGAALVASRSGSTPRTPPRARFLSAPPGGNARSRAGRGVGFTTALPLRQFARRRQRARRWSTRTGAQEMRRTRASAAATVCPTHTSCPPPPPPTHTHTHHPPIVSYTNTKSLWGSGIGDLATMEIVDKIHIPSDLPEGDWVLGWRWDCENRNL